MLELTINNHQKVTVTLNPVDQDGNPEPVDGIPAWVVQSGNSTVVPAADGMSADLISEDGVGDTVFGVSADADPGPGVQTIQDTITLHVVHEFASNLGLTAGQPVPK